MRSHLSPSELSYGYFVRLPVCRVSEGLMFVLGEVFGNG